MSVNCERATLQETLKYNWNFLDLGNISNIPLEELPSNQDNSKKHHFNVYYQTNIFYITDKLKHQVAEILHKTYLAGHTMIITAGAWIFD